jgi:precorrin-6B methylase 1
MVHSNDSPHGQKQGSLIIVGSGIKSVGHLTLETQGWIKQADIVIYCVADPVTEIWIKKNSRRHFDLYSLYGNEKKRIDTYNDMVETMLKYVRKGMDVCGVFYGHPGIFVLPSHKAIKIARSEGYAASLLPAISALDCLFADLGVDPSSHGCLEYEATDMLLRKRPLQNDMHAIIWQIGCVGDLGFKFAGYDNRNLHILVDYLEQSYNPDHVVTHYQGSQYPICKAFIEEVCLKDLRKSKVTGISTLYIPPQEKKATDTDMARKLGLTLAGTNSKTVTPTANTVKTAATAATGSTQPPAKTAAMEYMPAPNNSGLATFIADMAENPSLLTAFIRNPKGTIYAYADMTQEEEKALLTMHPGVIRMCIKNHKDFPHLDEIYKAHTTT